MRFKKQIIIICLFTFLFLPFQIEKNKINANADVLTMSYISFEIITALLLSTGIVITDNKSHVATVNEIYERRVKEVKAMEQQVLNGERFSLSNEVISTVKEVYNLTYGNEFEEKIYRFNDKLAIGEGIPLAIGEWAVELQKGQQYYPYDTGTKGFTGESGIYIFKVFRIEDNKFVHKLLTQKGAIFGNGTSYVLEDGTIFKCLTGSLNLLFEGAVDWNRYRNANKALDIDKKTAALSGNSVCAKGTLSSDMDKEFDNSKNYEYPLTDEQIGVQVAPDVLNPDDVLDKPSVDETDAPTTGETLWDTLFGFLKTLFSPITNLLSSLWDLIKGLFDMLKGLLTSILDLLKSLVKSLVDAIASIFIPTLALGDVFNLNQNTFFGQVAEVFNFEKLWNLTPKPYEFEVDFPFYDFTTEEHRPYHLEIKFFENKFMKENINLIRNITTYPLLLISIYFVIMHFLPKRDMD